MGSFEMLSRIQKGYLLNRDLTSACVTLNKNYFPLTQLWFLLIRVRELDYIMSKESFPLRFHDGGCCNSRNFLGF